MSELKVPFDWATLEPGMAFLEKDHIRVYAGSDFVGGPGIWMSEMPRTSWLHRKRYKIIGNFSIRDKHLVRAPKHDITKPYVVIAFGGRDAG